MSRLALLTIALAAATPALAQPAGPAYRSASPLAAPDYRSARPFASCPAGLKYAAGACVPTCPGGYADVGHECVFRNMNHSYVRVQGFWARLPTSGLCRGVRSDGIQRHGMGDGALRRRSIKLLCAGWLPHSVFRLGAVPV
jgi:hypothetical protein